MTAASDHTILRVILDEPLPGPANMAVDEAILHAVNDRLAPATLRLYAWSEPTISLGYFQPFAQFESDPAIRHLAVVRRPTGGGAILHDDEITYSLALPLDPDDRWDIEPVYRLVHDAAVAVLADAGLELAYRGGRDRENAQRGPFFCFARTHRLDLTVAGRKILGSAQRRLRRGVLQHGSLILGDSVVPQGGASIASVSSCPFERDAFCDAFAARIARDLGLTPAPATLSPAEHARLEEFTRKYTGPEWTRIR